MTRVLRSVVRSVAICTVGELFGGVERHVLGMAGGLQQASISTLLILFHDGELAAQARSQGAEVAILPNRNLSLWSTARTLAEIFGRRSIDLVHVHGYKATVFCALARRWYSLPVIKTEHGLPEPMGRNPVRALRDRAYHLSDRVATRVVGAAVCYVTRDLLARYRKAHRGLRREVIQNGVAVMNRADFGRPRDLLPDCFNLAIVGRLDHVKGIHLAIEAMAVGNLPTDIHLHVVGTGPCEDELRTLAETLGISRRVSFVGFRRNVYDYLAHCDALVMPSLHEGLPYTLLEAMALGTPIVASRVGGLVEVLEDNVTALLVPPGNASRLSTAIHNLRNDDALRRELGGAAQHVQRTHFSLAGMANRYLAVYQAVLQGEC